MRFSPPSSYPLADPCRSVQLPDARLPFLLLASYSLFISPLMLADPCRSAQLPDARLRLEFVYGYDGMQVRGEFLSPSCTLTLTPCSLPPRNTYTTSHSFTHLSTYTHTHTNAEYRPQPLLHIDRRGRLLRRCGRHRLRQAEPHSALFPRPRRRHHFDGHAPGQAHCGDRAGGLEYGPPLHSCGPSPPLSLSLSPNPLPHTLTPPHYHSCSLLHTHSCTQTHTHTHTHAGG